MNTTLDSPIKWHGGKHYFAKKFVELMPPHIHYVEPYFGGGAVLFARDPNHNWAINQEWHLRNGECVPASMKGCSEVVNDIHGALTNFWRVLADEELFERFKRRIEGTPPGCEAIFEEAAERLANRVYLSGGEPVREAADFFICCRQSRAATFKDFTTIAKTRTRRGMNELPSAWLSAIDGLPEVHERLKRVVILNRDALEVIRTQDGPATLFYCDPPYLHETRATKDAYTHEMSPSDHAGLLNRLACIKGKFMLSGYRSELYDIRANMHGWNRHDFPTPNHAAGGKEKREMVECLWMNF